MISSQCEYAIQKYRKWRQVDAFCSQEKKNVECQIKKRLDVGKTGLECLPYEILLDTFSRLPLMSILRARYTCKGWQRIMTDPEFAELHLIRSIRSPGYLYRFSGDFDIYYVEDTVDGIESIKTVDALAHDYFFAGHASSGGLLACFAVKESCYYVSNPFIGERVKVRRGLIYLCNLSWGFGYSSSTKEYKLITFCVKCIRNKRVIQGEIYTLGSESWRQIIHVSLPPKDQQVDCDGTLFWLIHTRFYEEGPETVMSFDVGTEIIRAWRGPRIVQVIPKSELKLSYLAKFGDSVAYVMNQERCISIWILKDKVNDIWINEYKIVLEPPLRLPNLSFVGQWMNRLLFAGQDHIGKIICTSYDVDKEEFTMIQMPFWNFDQWGIHTSYRRPTQRNGFVRLIAHVGSFVSPLRIMSMARAKK